jgi:hypothetical protein
MPQLYQHRSNAWIVVAAAAGLVLAALLVCLAWTASERTDHIRLSLRDAAPTLPSLPRMPQGPKLPDAPIPVPK